MRRRVGDKILLASFDMDGTLLEEDSSWAAIHRHFGTPEKGLASLELYTRGKIDYKEFMRRDISSWPSGVTRQEIEGILFKYRLRPEAPVVVEGLRERGIDVALVTSGIDLLAERVAADLKIEHWVANGLRFDRRGVLQPAGVGRVDPRRKDMAYRRLLRRLHLKSKQTIAIGDTIYDLAFLKSARIGFMLAQTTAIQEPGIIQIHRLTDIFSHL
jgi:phosphoserine phosphatase